MNTSAVKKKDKCFVPAIIMFSLMIIAYGWFAVNNLLSSLSNFGFLLTSGIGERTFGYGYYYLALSFLNFIAFGTSIALLIITAIKKHQTALGISFRFIFSSVINFVYCFSLFAQYQYQQDDEWFAERFPSVFDYIADRWNIVFLYTLNIAVFVTLAVLLVSFFKKGKRGLGIALIVLLSFVLAYDLLYSVFFVVLSGLRYRFPLYQWIINSFSILFYISLNVLILIQVKIKLPKKAKKTAYPYFTPAAQPVTVVPPAQNTVSAPSQPAYRPAPAQPVQPAYKPAPAQPSGVSASSVSREMEQTELLIQYKKLLDMGIITQAEFEAKKNQLMQ